MGTTDNVVNSSEYGKNAAERVAKEHVVRQYGEFLVKFSTDIQTVIQRYENISLSSTTSPLLIELAPYEDIPLNDLIVSNNEKLNKVVLTLAYLLQELNLLIEETQPYHYKLLYYGEGINEHEFQQGACHTCSGKMVPLLWQILHYLNRCQDVVGNLLQQLSALYSENPNTVKYFDVSDAHFKIIFDHLGELLGNLVIIDSVVNHNPFLRQHVAQLQHVVRSVQHSPDTFGLTSDNLMWLDNLLNEISEKVLSGTVFFQCVTQDFGSTVACNNVFLKEMGMNIVGFLQDLFTVLNRENQHENLDHLEKFMGYVCLHILHARISSKVDKKQLKLVLDCSKIIVAVPLVGPCLWFPEQCLSLNLPQGKKLVDSKIMESISTTRFNYLRQKSQQLTKDVQLWNSQIVIWLSRLGGCPGNQEEFTEQCNLILQGLRFVGYMGATIRLVLNLHLNIQPVISKSVVLNIFRVIELIKTVEEAIKNRLNSAPQCLLYLQEQLRRSAMEILATAKNVLANEKRSNDRLSTMNSALALAEHVLNGPCTKPRVSIARLSLALVCGQHNPRILREDHLPVLVTVLQKMELVSKGLERRVSGFSNCELLYWHKSLLATYFSEIHEKHSEMMPVAYTLRAVFDCHKAIKQIVHSEPENLLSSYENFVCTALKRYILDPMCSDIETEMRFQTHSHLQQTDRDPFKSDFCSLGNQLKQVSFNVGSNKLNVKAYVEHYLGKTFYNLAAVAAHDWRKYGEMRLLAKHLFYLNPIEDRLPSQTLEQGLDILEIMRNIHVFVSRFSYNLNNQFFIEHSSCSKHLNTVSIRHASNSIRTHGTGIVNTAVNFTYQFLRKKFYIFSQFLYDEHIKSRLMKDARYLRELREKEDPQYKQENSKYPYDRAEKFHRGIRKLGINSQGLTYLDQFRILLTHIGNGLGYVRMLRSGAIHCCAESCAAVPDLAELVDLSETTIDNLADRNSSVSNLRDVNETLSCINEGLFESLAKNDTYISSLSSQCSKDLDKVIDNLARSLSEGSDYFKLLVNVFKPFFQDPRHTHLRHFYLIVPPLMVNFVEHIVTCKEKLNKKNKQDIAFTDDGLAMGVAYCLSVLEQWKDFDALQWLASVKDYFVAQRAHANNVSQGQDSEKLQQTLSLTIHRLDTYNQEFELLFYNLNSARIFFRQDGIGGKSPSTSSLAGDVVQASRV